MAARGPREIARLTASFHRLLDRLAAARQRAARSERLATLGKVCLSVAHELRNPLSGIKMNVRVLKDRLPPSGDDPGLDVILTEIERMDLYLNELMTFSTGAPAAEAPAATPPAPVRLSELADSVLSILAARCRHANVRVAAEYPPDQPLVRGDANQLRQVMMNLIVNAIEAMPSGGDLRIRVRADRGSASFRVADTGPGVRPERGCDIFDAFVSTKPNGVGLGLYLARRIVTRHGGRIGYDDSPAGAEFWFELPSAPPHGPAA
jgi:signal transduction histidine kinase